MTSTELVDRTGIHGSALIGGLAALKRARMIRVQSFDDRQDRWFA